MILRDYQRSAVDETYSLFNEGRKRILWYMIMGAGKTATCNYVTKELDSYGIPVSIIVRRRELVKQMSRCLSSWGIKHGVNMAGHCLFDPKRNVQLSSVDTLGSRKIYPHAENTDTVVFIDEMQDANSKTYKDIIEKYSRHRIIGMSGTPFRDNSMFEAIVNPISPMELHEKGILVKERVFAPSQIDTDGCRIVKGDFVNADIEKKAMQSKIVGNIIEEWKSLGGNRPTLLFAVSVKHSQTMVEAFRNEGIGAVHIDANSSSEEREDAVKKLLSGEINVICNVDIFSVGFDCPDISCVILARPTQSIIWHLQATARGLRASANKSDCIVLDHAGNYFRHGFILETREATLSGIPLKYSAENELKLRTCKHCFYIFQIGECQCPQCGYVNQPIERKVKTEDGLLVEINMSPEQIEVIREKSFISEFYRLGNIAKLRGLHNTWIYSQLLKKHGNEKCKNYGRKIRFPEALLA